MRRDALALAVGSLIVSAVCVRLGFWQWQRLGRAHQAEAVEEAAFHEPEWVLRDSLPHDVPASMRRVRLHGHWEDSTQVMLSGQTGTAGAGVLLVGVFRLGSGDAVLVERGWLPAADGRRARLDGLPMTDSTVLGTVERLPEKVAPDWVELPRWEYLPQVRLWSARVLTSRTVAAHIPGAESRWWLHAMLSGESPGTEWQTAIKRARELQEHPDARAQMHLSYALQWFGFAAIALFGGLALALRRRG